MSPELKVIFDQFANLIERWNCKDIPNYEELLAETIKLNANLTRELRKPRKEQTKIV